MSGPDLQAPWSDGYKRSDTFVVQRDDGSGWVWDCIVGRQVPTKTAAEREAWGASMPDPQAIREDADKLRQLAPPDWTGNGSVTVDLDEPWCPDEPLGRTMARNLARGRTGKPPLFAVTTRDVGAALAGSVAPEDDEPDCAECGVGAQTKNCQHGCSPVGATPTKPATLPANAADERRCRWLMCRKVALADSEFCAKHDAREFGPGAVTEDGR